MGRFGNVMLTSGEADLSLKARHGEVVRFYLTNTANTRVFSRLPVDADEARGGDSGHYEREEMVEAPSRAVRARSWSTSSSRKQASSSSSIGRPSAPIGLRPSKSPRTDRRPQPPRCSESYGRNHDMAELRERIKPYRRCAPDKTLSFVAEMDMGVPEGVPVSYVCPMHPEVVSEEPGSCPKWG